MSWRLDPKISISAAVMPSHVVGDEALALLRRRRDRGRERPGPGHPRGVRRIDVVEREVGGWMVRRPRHVHELRVEVQHDRGLHQAGVFQRPSGEALGPGGLHGLLGDVLPVRDLGDPHVADAVAPETAQREVDAFHQEHVVLVVAVHHRHAAHAVAGELAHDVADHADQGLAVEAGGAGKVVAAAGFRLRLVAVAEGGRDQVARARRDPLGQRGRYRGVAVHGQVRAVLLQRAHR